MKGINTYKFERYGRTWQLGFPDHRYAIAHAKQHHVDKVFHIENDEEILLGEKVEIGMGIKAFRDYSHPIQQKSCPNCED